MFAALWLAAGVSVVPVPKHAIDHVGLGCADLDAGVAFVAERTGVVAAPGGIHPGRGTRNALLGLGEGTYLEIIAPVPGHEPTQDNADLGRLPHPKPVFFAVRSPDLDASVRLLSASGFDAGPIRPGSR